MHIFVSVPFYHIERIPKHGRMYDVTCNQNATTNCMQSSYVIFKQTHRREYTFNYNWPLAWQNEFYLHQNHNDMIAKWDIIKCVVEVK